MTYAVSHDFQAPLRHIREFNRLLFDRIAVRADDRERTYMRMVNNSIQRCDAMMAALLECSRVYSQGAPGETVDCNRLVDEAAQLLQRHLDSGDMRIHLEPLPTVRGDAAQLGRVFFHLLENAVKFKRENVMLDVTVRAQPWVGGWRIEVADNGIGVETNMAEKIFGLFKKVDPESPGIGVGLAFCSQVAQRHGGAISCRQNTPNGTVFCLYHPHKTPL